MKNPNSHQMRFCPKCSSPKLFSDSVKSFTCPDCGFKLYFNCAAAVIGLITNAESKILVTRRKKDPFKGLLDFPGGFADPGESIEQALKREIKEELNLEIVLQTFFCSLPNVYVYRGISYDITDMVFCCRVKRFEPIKACDDVEDYQFKKIEDLAPDQFGLPSAKILVDIFKTNPPSFL